MNLFVAAKAKVFLLMITLAMLIPGYVQADTINVEAYIDGRSRLHIQGNTAKWEHFDWDAPGWADNYATEINGVDWFPTWLGDPTGCNGCFSSNVFTSVTPLLDAVDQTVILNPMHVRDSVTIIQQPAAANSYELIVEFNDNITPGAIWYEIELQARSSSSIPTMTEWGMIIFILLAGFGAVYYLRRQRNVER